jgi:hypothetical protein
MGDNPASSPVSLYQLTSVNPSVSIRSTNKYLAGYPHPSRGCNQERAFPEAQPWYWMWKSPLNYKYKIQLRMIIFYGEILANPSGFATHPNGTSVETLQQRYLFS